MVSQLHQSIGQIRTIITHLFFRETIFKKNKLKFEYIFIT